MSQGHEYIPFSKVCFILRAALAEGFTRFTERYRDSPKQTTRPWDDHLALQTAATFHVRGSDQAKASFRDFCLFVEEQAPILCSDEALMRARRALWRHPIVSLRQLCLRQRAETRQAAAADRESKCIDFWVTDSSDLVFRLILELAI